MTTAGYGHRWLFLIPFLWQIAAVPLVNDVAWRPLSLPFPMAWQMVGIVITTIVIAIVFRLDERIDGDEDGADGEGLQGGDHHA